MSAPDLGFSASAWTRIVIGMGFCLAAVALVWLIERPRGEIRPAAHVEPAVVTAQDRKLVIESTFPVATWSVSVLGRQQAVVHTDAFSWAGTVSAQTGEEILISASATPEDRLPNHGLRIIIAGNAPRLEWGGGEVTATVVNP